MKLQGSYKFRATAQQVFNGILNPEVLRLCIPGCQSVEHLSDSSMRVKITVPFPGLKGPYSATIRAVQRQEPSVLVLEIKREGAAGSIDGVGSLNIADEVDGAVLTYDGHMELKGPIAIADSSLGQGIVKRQLASFIKNLDKALI